MGSSFMLQTKWPYWRTDSFFLMWNRMCQKLILKVTSKNRNKMWRHPNQLNISVVNVLTNADKNISD